jgi:hypothetical protein
LAEYVGAIMKLSTQVFTVQIQVFGFFLTCIRTRGHKYSLIRYFELFQFELLRRQVTDYGVNPFTVVKTFDVAEDLVLCLLQIHKGVVLCQLHLQCPEKNQ